MQNESYMIEKYYDEQYERMMSRSEDVKECAECEGNGKTEYCGECDEHFIKCNCKQPDYVTCVCDVCKGTGIIND